MMRKTGKRLAAACLSAVLLSVSFAAAAAGETSSGTVDAALSAAEAAVSGAEIPGVSGAEAAVSAAEIPGGSADETAVSAAEEAAGFGANPADPGQSTAEIIGLILDRAGSDKVRDELARIREFLYSEKVQSLMKYPEVQELILESAERFAGLVLTDPALSKKILMTLGVDEQMTDIMMELIKTAVESVDEAGVHIDREAVREISERLEEYVDSGEVTEWMYALGLLVAE